MIDKPAGMVVHPAPGHSGGTLVNAVLHHCPGIAGVGGERRPGIVHRLDKDTSGLIVVAKHDVAMRSLQAQFKARTVFKEYLALLEGRLQPEQGRISAPIGRHPTERKRMAVLAPDSPGAADGREAVTSYRVLGVYTGSVYGRSTSVATFSLVSAVLHTGRTHQIRVHFAWLQHPVVGDTLYGFRTPRLPLHRQFLHAHRLRLRLPSSGEEREFVAPLPADLQRLLDWARRQWLTQGCATAFRCRSCTIGVELGQQFALQVAGRAADFEGVACYARNTTFVVRQIQPQVPGTHRTTSC